jgi:RNA polymerase sigma-70 factor (ECF subfamily)
MMDVTQFGRLVDEHAAALMLYARQFCAAPEDVVQEALLKLFVQEPPPVPVAPWLYRVVRNAAIAAARSEQRRRHHEARAARAAPAWFQPAAESALDVAEVTAALQTLPADQREAIALHLWGGLTFAEIAQIVGGSSSSAHRSYAAGLRRLRERLNACPNPTRKT